MADSPHQRRAESQRDSAGLSSPLPLTPAFQGREEYYAASCSASRRVAPYFSRASRSAISAAKSAVIASAYHRLWNPAATSARMASDEMTSAGSQRRTESSRHAVRTMST